MIVGFAGGTHRRGLVAPHQEGYRGSVVVQPQRRRKQRQVAHRLRGNLISRFGEAFDARRQFFSTLASSDNAGTRCAIWCERSIARVLETPRQVNNVMFSNRRRHRPCLLSRVLRTRPRPGARVAPEGATSARCSSNRTGCTKTCPCTNVQPVTLRRTGSRKPLRSSCCPGAGSARGLLSLCQSVRVGE